METAFDVRVFAIPRTHPRKQFHRPIDRKETVMIATAIIWALILCLFGMNGDSPNSRQSRLRVEQSAET
jgi:hypothetical protein